MMRMDLFHFFFQQASLFASIDVNPQMIKLFALIVLVLTH